MKEDWIVLIEYCKYSMDSINRVLQNTLNNYFLSFNLFLNYGSLNFNTNFNTNVFLRLFNKE